MCSCFNSRFYPGTNPYPLPQPSVPPSAQPSVVPSTQPSAAPITVTKITIDDKDLTPQAGSQLNLHLPISDPTKETDVPIRILVTYSDSTTKPFVINFHYKPKQQTIPTSDQTKELKVLVLKYFPLDSSGSQLNENITGMNTSLANIRQYVDNLTQQGLQKLTEGSRYHGSKTNSPPALQYNLIGF